MDKLTVYLFVVLAFSCQDVLCKKREHKQKENGGKIVGGTETTIQEYPYQAYLLLYNGSDYFQCGGSIVNAYYVVTAAHCLEEIQTVYVRIGSTISNSGGLQYETSTFYSHPSYNPNTFDFDVGIVSVSQGMQLDGTNAKAISLVRTFYDVSNGTEITLTGWGATGEGESVTSTLRVVSVPAIDRPTCNEQLGGGITSRMFCAGLPEGGKDTCQGDSGGPAVIESTGRLAGIVSFGYGCARPDSPGVYTRIGNFQIRNYIRLMTGA
uniref:Peptidase S1 domain-containing protein n=1 Tax=Heliothis virescens TaxID=7102 RepID=A0A2A4IV60_HELVI